MNYQERFLDSNNKKHEEWLEGQRKIELLVDKLGRGIDEGIKETLAGLSLFGINTTASCEGHKDHGTFAPYIDIEAKEALKVKQLRENKSDKEIEQLNQQIEKINLKERLKLIKLLDEFYSKRQVSFHKRLTIQSKARGWSRLESIGAELQLIADPETQSKHLSEYQEEMRAFTEFLKRKYLNL